MVGRAVFLCFHLVKLIEYVPNAYRYREPVISHIVALDHVDDDIYDVTTIDTFWHIFQNVFDHIFLHACLFYWATCAALFLEV
jgi:hypothetical protein